MKKRVSVFSLAVICIIVAAVSFLCAWTITQKNYKTALSGFYSDESTEFFSKLDHIKDLYKENCLYGCDLSSVQEETLKAFVAATGDKYGRYYTKEEYAEFNRQQGEAGSVSYEYMSEEEIGYISVLHFNDSTPSQFRAAYTDLLDKGARGLVIDLRGNGGGSLSSLISTLSVIMPEDTLISKAEFTNGETEEYKTKSSGFVGELSLPAAVITDKTTASAAELFVAVLKDMDKAVQIGETTYGKGVLQEMFALSDGSAVKITAGRFTSPLGNDYDGKGLSPDIPVEDIGKCPDLSEDPAFLRAAEELRNREGKN